MVLHQPLRDVSKVNVLVLITIDLPIQHFKLIIVAKKMKIMLLWTAPSEKMEHLHHLAW